MRDHLEDTAEIRARWWVNRSQDIVRKLHRALARELSKYDAFTVLIAVYAYMQYAQFEVPLPPFLHFDELDRKPMRLAGLAEWELDVLSREALAYSSISGGRQVSKQSDVATLINLIKRLEENIWRAYPHGHRDILLELNRLSHRQFPWQRPTNHPAIARYFKVYSDPKVEEVLHRVTGLNTIELFRAGVGLTGYFLEKSVLPIPVPAALRVDRQQLDNFLKRFAATILDLRQHIQSNAAFGVNWAYVSNPLRDRPLVAVVVNGRPHYLCPIPSFLLVRLTSGIYYELIHDDAFANPFGASFQRYIGDVLGRVNAKMTLPFKIFAERKYGPASKRKDTVDWIATDASANLFIEVKAKRLAVKAKIDLESREAMESQVSKMAEFVVQVYKTIADALGGKYPEWKPNSLPIYPIVVTLEEWFPLGPVIHGMLDSRVTALMLAAKLDVGMLEEMPYTVASSDDFEMALHVMSKRGINTVMSERCTEQKREWLFAGVLSHSFANELSDAEMLFPEVWKDILGQDLN